MFIYVRFLRMQRSVFSYSFSYPRTLLPCTCQSRTVSQSVRPAVVTNQSTDVRQIF